MQRVIACESLCVCACVCMCLCEILGKGGGWIQTRQILSPSRTSSHTQIVSHTHTLTHHYSEGATGVEPAALIDLAEDSHVPLVGS